jgi:hypothetical protein
MHNGLFSPISFLNISDYRPQDYSWAGGKMYPIVCIDFTFHVPGL